MIMKRLTPEQALKAFIENKQIYSLTEVDPTITVQELIHSDGFVIFEPTAEKEPNDEGRGEAPENVPEHNTDVPAQPKQAKRGRPKKEV